MREDEREPADPVDDFKHGIWVSGNNAPTREGSLPVNRLGKGDEIANLVDSFLIRKREATVLSVNTESGDN